MSERSYWERIVQNRIGRRRAFAGMGSMALGATALSLIGCGSDDSSSGAIEDKSGLVHRPVDSTSSAKPGGVYRHFSSADTTHFDPAISDSSQVSGLSATPFYPTLVDFKAGKFPNDADGSSEGYFAESWEMSPDRLTLTFKVRQGMKWDNRAPTNGRNVNAQDVLATWDKYKQFNPGASSIAYHPETAAGSAVESWSAPDANTIVAKMHAPDASILPLLSTRFYIMPIEATNGGFDARTTVRGHGPFVLEDYAPSTRFVWAKNPNYFKQGRPFFDKVEVPIVAEQAARLAQFKTGNIYSDVLEGGQEDIVITKKDHPATALLQASRFPERVIWFMTFGWEEGSAYRDTRVRQAVSMMIDREAYADVIDNRDRFARDGLDVPVRWNSVVGAGWGDYWLDPDDEKTFGDNARYLKLNLEEAKKLLTAAGHANGLESDFNFLTTGQFGPIYNRVADVYTGMLGDGGLRLRMNPMEFNDWVNNISQGYRSKQYKAGERKGFSGIGMQGERGYPTTAVQVYNQFNAAGQGYRGNSPDGRNIADGDPKLNDLTIQINREFDAKKQQSMVHDLIRYATGMAYYIPQPSSAKNFTLWWPVVGNLGAETPYPGTNLWTSIRSNWWLDTTKPPLGNA